MHIFITFIVLTCEKEGKIMNHTNGTRSWINTIFTIHYGPSTDVAIGIGRNADSAFEGELCHMVEE